MLIGLCIGYVLGIGTMVLVFVIGSRFRAMEARRADFEGRCEVLRYCIENNVAVVTKELLTQFQNDITKLKERYKEYERLWEITDTGTCDGECNANDPYERCPECAAGALLNELGEIRGDGLRDIEQSLKAAAATERDNNK